MKASLVQLCVFTNQPPPTDGTSYQGAITSTERAMYEAIGEAFGQVLTQRGDFPATLYICHANAPNNKKVMQTAGVTTANVPFIIAIGSYPDGSGRLYVLKTQSVAAIKKTIEALLDGDFSGAPGSVPAEGSEFGVEGGSGDGSILCAILPVLCRLGFWPWAALVAFTTYRTFEANSKVGKGMWGAAALLSWQSFISRGGLKQLGQMVGIGSIRLEDIKAFGKLEQPPSAKKLSKKFIEDVEQILYVEYPDAEKDFLLSRLFQRHGFIYSRDAALKINYAAYKANGGYRDFEYISKKLFKQ